MSKNIVLRVNDLTVSTYDRQHLIKDVSLTVEKGQVLGIVGESGSGKTTLCMALLGLLDEHLFNISGSAYINSDEIKQLNSNTVNNTRGKQISIIMQNPMTAFNPLIKIGDHFMETLIYHKKVNKKQAYDLAVMYLKKMKLPRIDQLMKSYSFQLSGGMLQRVMIAIAIAMDPDLLIADEPTASLDVKTQYQILAEIEKVKQKYNMSILFVSHDFRVIAQIADYVGVMHKGQLIEYGKALEVFDNAKHDYTKKLLSSSIHYSVC